jgi:hypothetical protein
MVIFQSSIFNILCCFGLLTGTAIIKSSTMQERKAEFYRKMAKEQAEQERVRQILSGKLKKPIKK